MHFIKSFPWRKYTVYIFKWIPIMMPGDRVVLFHIFSQLYKFSLSSINFLFQIVWPFELHFISIKFIFTHSRQIGEYLTREFWDMDFLVGQEGRGRGGDIKMFIRRKNLFLFIPNRFEAIFENSYAFVTW